MTRLFNLESYVECCQYARLFDESPEKLIPPDGNSPHAYKAFLQKYAHHPYLHEPIFDASSRPSQVGWALPTSQVALPTSQVALPTSQVGQTLPTTNQGDKQRLLIIRDTVDLMTLSMSNLLEYRDGYLYSSAYHYWNHFSEISRLKLTKPLVFVDLDSFEIQRLIPIKPDTSPYKVPILDTRTPIILDSVYNTAENYNNICRELATRILQRQFHRLANSDETITHLSHYLQKISFFQKIQPYIAQETLTFIVEILWQGEIFYKQVTLRVATLAAVVSAGINTAALNHLATQHPDYQFVLISQYNILNIQHIISHYICLSPICQEFGEKWAEKIQSNFSLFAIYLDSIEFAIGMSGSEEWIKLSSQESTISYEGKSILLRGRIPTTNRDSFLISQRSTARLPIRVNGEDYYRDGKPQDYSLEIQNYQGTEDVRVCIDFHLQPGSFPELRVTDLEGRYRITTALIPRPTYDHIPPQKINDTRQKQSAQQIARLISRIDLDNFRSHLSQISAELNNLSNRNIRKFKRLEDLLNIAYQRVHGANANNDILQFIEISSTEVVALDLNSAFQQESLGQIVELICEFLNRGDELNWERQRLLLSAIMFVGKTYKFSQYLSPGNLFSETLINRANQIRVSGNPGDEYLQCLARVAVSEPLQSQYFAWFDSYYEKEKYMWGYGRILFWYYNFDAPNELLNYRKHFTVILDYLLSNKLLNIQYKQNAFLALLYLLTFRAKDQTFCQAGSKEMERAEKVIEHFKGEWISLKKVDKKKPLNQFFKEMIEGTLTDVDGLLKADLQ